MKKEANKDYLLKEKYELLPELTRTVIHDLEKSGKVLTNTDRIKMQKEYILAAIQDPGWVNELSQGYNSVSNLLKRSTPEKLAAEINQRDSLLGYKVESALILRSLELMNQKYPNLCLTRGHCFSYTEGIQGGDYSLGDLDNALTFARSTQQPVIALMSLKKFLPYAIATLRNDTNIHVISTEIDWARNAYEIDLENNARLKISMLEIYRVNQ